MKTIEGIKAATQEVVRKMTQSYKDLEEDYLGKILKKNEEIAQQREQIKGKQADLANKQLEK